MKRIFALSLFLLLSSFNLTNAGNVTMAPQFVQGFPAMVPPNVMLMWMPVPNAIKYKIYQNGKPVGEAPPGLPFNVPIPKKSGLYKYSVTGVDAAGEEGPASREGLVTVSKISPPKEISHTFLGNILNLRWEVVKDAVIYDLYKSETVDGEYKMQSSSNESRYVDDRVRQVKENYGKKFYYKIKSKNKFSVASGFSEPYEVLVTKPEEPKPDAVPDIKLKAIRAKRIKLLKPMGGGTGIKSVFDAALMPDGSIAYVDMHAKVVAYLDEYGNRKGIIGDYGKEPHQIELPYRFTIDPDGNYYIYDLEKKSIISYDSNNKFRYTKKLALIKGQELYDQVPKLKNKPTPPKPNSIMYHDGKLFLPGKVFGLVQIYDAKDGSFIDYYRDIKKDKLVIVGVVSCMLVDAEQDTIYFGQSFAQKVSVFRLSTGELLYDIGRSKSFIGAFGGVNGICFDSEKNVVVSDGLMHSVQFFSRDDGKYLYHLKGPKIAPDIGSKNARPYFRLSFPGPIMSNKKGEIIVYDGDKRGFAVFKILSRDVWDITVDKPEEGARLKP